MNRRDFSLAAPTLAMLSTATWMPAYAQALKPAEGTDYYVLDKPVAVDAPAGKIEAS